MQSNFEDFLRAAEDHYLQASEMNGFKQQIDALQDRLALYEVLRDQELAIFQVVANQLQKEAFTSTQVDQEKVLTHWISVLRYCAMAMLINQPEILANQLVWLADAMNRDECSALNQKIRELLHQCLRSVLNEEQMALIESFLKQADVDLGCEDRFRELSMLG